LPCDRRSALGTPSLRWLLYLTRRLEGVPLLVVAATRPPEGESRDPALVAELIADPEATGIRPGPLGRASIAVLARELHGLRPDEAFCAALETATGGNRLFMGAVLDAVAREGISPTGEQVPRLVEIGAQGVCRAVGLRLARLPPEANIGGEVGVTSDANQPVRDAESWHAYLQGLERLLLLLPLHSHSPAGRRREASSSRPRMN
jgi:hypothetical protein